jgi:hypothetical protein
MILLNFAHPLADRHIAVIERLADKKVEKILALPVQFNNSEPFKPQLQELMANIELTSEEWQTKPVLVNLPSLNTIAALLLAELHGRMGYFPPVLRLRPIADTTPTQFEIAEILNLQTMRENARKER